MDYDLDSVIEVSSEVVKKVTLATKGWKNIGFNIPRIPNEVISAYSVSKNM